MNFEIEDASLSGIKIITGKRFHDNRGYFSENYKTSEFNKLGIPSFVQDNVSVSKKGVIRGLHWQNEPFGQGKLVQCVSGSIFDVAVDIRKNSPNFGKYFSLELNDRESKFLWIPDGFAHGFQALEDGTIVSYKVTSFWQPTAEKSLNWNDPSININWDKKLALIISEKDSAAPFIDSI